METMEQFSFKMISCLGGAKSNFMEAIQLARIFDFEKSQELIEEGNQLLQKGHDIHFELLKEEANGKETPFSLLLVHSEDQLMSAEVLKILAEELLENYKVIQTIKK